MKYFNLLLLLCFIYACSNTETSKNVLKSNPLKFNFSVTNLTDAAYPDNPDIGYRSSDYDCFYYTNGTIEVVNSQMFRVSLKFEGKADTLILKNLDLSEFIPTIPAAIKSDEYLSFLSIVNQEWNRNQVSFSKKHFKSQNKKIIRVDIARNCLNAYLWEIAIYVLEDGKEVPYSHGWFDFPHELYAQFFKTKNTREFAEFKPWLENWQDPESKSIDFKTLRKVLDTVAVAAQDLSDQMYPLAKARLKKRKEVIYPIDFITMRELQTDSALFATFTPPGFYNKNDPRVTELGRFYTLTNTRFLQVKSAVSGDTLYEVQLTFKHQTNYSQTTLVLGGLDLKDFPVLDPEKANNGWKTSMGFANHTFYETYSDHIKNKTEEQPYYGFLIDEQGRWLDSHKVGIDGPIFHFTDSARTKLNLWLLSFERHALVGRYQVSLDSEH